MAAAAGMLILGSCTNLEIGEEEAFDVRRTISPRYFDIPAGDDGPELEEVHFTTSDGLELEGWWISQKGAENTVLYVGGNGFVIASSFHIITSIIEQRVNLFVFNYRGYGTNPGSPSVEGEIGRAHV